ncbi:MAG: 16S rRNA (adenine(1518)-N(6)/adenine(1519)-N(6))-dimethyltransferase RsmA [Bryobacteraceae bacterium]
MPRRLGQHFLVRQSVLERIAAAVAPEPAGRIVEVGPGKGALTEHLLTRTGQLIAIEIDQVLAHYLRAKFREYQTLSIVESDVLKTDLAQWGPVVVAGNLPYYISSPIFEKVLRLGPLLQRAVFLVQKEVAERVSADPGSRDYGYLTVQTQFLAHAELLFEVPAAAFRPPPKVESAVIRLTPRAVPFAPDTAAFLEFASRCFQHKRKTLRNNLLPYYGKAALDGLAETAKRGEQLGIEELVRLHDKLRTG